MQLADMKARRELAKFGMHVQVSPAQALLAMVHEAAGNVAYLGGRIDDMIERQEIAEAERARDIIGQAEMVAIGNSSVYMGLTSPAGGSSALIGPVLAVDKDGREHQIGEDARAMMRLYGEWSDRLVKYSKAAIDAGVAKAQVELARRQAEMIVTLFKTVLVKLMLSDAQIKSAQEMLAGEMRKLAAPAAGSLAEMHDAADAERPVKKSRAMETRSL